MKMGSGRLPTPLLTWICESADEPGAGVRPGRVTHCCFEHAGQNFGSLDRGPQATRHGIGGCDWRTSELKHEPEEIPDAEHEMVIERVCAIDVAKASGKVCVRMPRGRRRVSTVWDVPAMTCAVTELAEQLVELGIEKVTVESTSDYWRIWY